MAGRKTKFEALKATETWGNLLRKTDYLATDVSKQDIYKTKPVDLHTFVTSPDYLGQDFFGGLSEPQFEFVDNLADLENGLTYFVLVVGKGGGKNFTCQVAFLYIVYNLLCMYDANTYLKHPKNKPITLMNMAINANQALDNFFEPLTTIVRSAGQKAFKDFGFNPSTDIFKDYVVFPQNIQIISTHSQAGGVEGYDILVGMIDECDDAEFHGVNRAIDTLRSSSDSRFKKKGKVAVISYIRYEGSSGKIMEEYERAQGHSHIYAQKYASWEFNPNLTKDDFKNKFDENPEKAACIYGSEFSGSFVDSWIKDYKRIKNSMNINRPSLINFPLPYDPDIVGSPRWLNKMAHSEWRSKAMSEHTYINEKDEVITLDPYDIPLRYFGNPSYKYVLVGDPALGSEQNGGDGYGICLAHRESVVIDGVKYIRPIIDFVFRFTGRMFKEGQVQMEAVRKLIYKLKSEYGFNIKIFSFDGWNCRSPESYLHTTSGLKKMKDILTTDELVSHNGTNTINNLEYVKDIDCIKIITDNGIELISTKNHPYLLNNGNFVQANNIKIGDRIVHNTQSKLYFGKKDAVNLAKIFGYLIAEGNWESDDNLVCFNNSEDEVKNDFINSLQNLRLNQTYSKSKTTIRFYSKEFKSLLLDEVGVSGAFNKKVPKFIFSSNQKSVSMFLSSMYEGDGNVCIDKMQKNSVGIRVEYTTVSEELSKDIQMLLSQFNIKSYRKYYTNKWFNGVQRPYYRIVIRGREVKKFQDFIGFRSIRKNTKLSYAISLLKENARKPRFINSAKVVSIEPIVSDIIHMSVSGDNTYIADSFVNHNSADTTQWLAKTYPGSVIYEKNIVEIEDYTALRDAIFGESPPTFDFDTTGKLRNDLKAKNGGIDIHWHPVLYEELRNLREDKAKKKVDHPTTGNVGKDMADTVAKAVNILVYKYPLMEVLSAGVEKNHNSLINKVSQGIATNQEKTTHTEQINSKLFGLGDRFKSQQNVVNLYGTTSRRKEDFNG